MIEQNLTEKDNDSFSTEEILKNIKKKIIFWFFIELGCLFFPRIFKFILYHTHLPLPHIVGFLIAYLWGLTIVFAFIMLLIRISQYLLKKFPKIKEMFLYIILGISLLFNTYLIYKNISLNRYATNIEKKNYELIETPEQYYKKAIEEFSNNNYIVAKEKFNELIKKFPTNDLVKFSQEKIKEINLIEEKKKEEEQQIIKLLSKQIANAKNSLVAKEILDITDSKYDDSYSELKNFIKREREKQKENKLGGGYKNLKWGITRQQARKLINKRVYEEYRNALQFKLAEFEDLTLFFYKGKFYRAEYEIYIKPEKDGYHIKLLNELTNRFQEKPVETKNLSIRHGLIDMPIRYFYWEDKYTVVSLSYYDFEKEWTAKDINILTITYESKEISNEEKQDEYNKKQKEKEKQQQEQERNTNRIINNL